MSYKGFKLNGNTYETNIEYYTVNEKLFEEDLILIKGKNLRVGILRQVGVKDDEHARLKNRAMSWIQNTCRKHGVSVKFN